LVSNLYPLSVFYRLNIIINSYVNSVLQALYFCEPFRQLVTLQPDNSSLYPPQAPLPLPALPVPTVPSSNTTSPQTGLKQNQPSSSSTTASSSKPSSSGAKSASSSKVALPASKKAVDSRGGHRRPLSSHDGTTGTEEDRDAYGLNLAPEIPNNPPSLFVALRSLFVHISGHNQEKGQYSSFFTPSLLYVDCRDNSTTGIHR
jgi:ubiquitin carboxyl-terminal hydrolase 9/13